MSGANAPAGSALSQDKRTVEQRSHEPSMEEILASIRRIISDDQMLPLSPRASVPPLPPVNAAVPSPPRQAVERESTVAAAQAEHEHRAATREPDATAFDDRDDVGHDADNSSRDQHHDDVLDLADVAHVDHESASDRPFHAAGPVTPPTAIDTMEPVMPAPDETPPKRTSEPTVDGAASDEPQTIAAAHPQPQAEKASEPKHEPIVSDTTVSSVSSSFHHLAATMLVQNFPPVDEIARELLRPMIKTWLDDNLPMMVERLVRAEIERVARVGR